jgi:hypothetical protein
MAKMTKRKKNLIDAGFSTTMDDLGFWHLLLDGRSFCLGWRVNKKRFIFNTFDGESECWEAALSKHRVVFEGAQSE